MMLLKSQRLSLSILFIVSFLLQLAGIYSRGTSGFWVREPGSAIDWSLGATPLVSALLAGYCCYVGGNLLPANSVREGMSQIRVFRFFLFSCGPAVVIVTSAALLNTIIVLIRVYAERGNIVIPNTLGLLAVLFTMYMASSLIGTSLGAMLPGPVTPVVVSSLGALFFFLGDSIGLGNLVRLGGSTGSIADFELRAQSLIVWVSLWVCIGIASALLIFIACALNYKVAIVRVAALSFILVATHHFIYLAGGNGQVYQLIKSPPSHCSDESPIVCVRAGSGFSPEKISNQIKPLLKPLSEVREQGQPEKWYVTSVSPPPGNGIGNIWANSTGSSKIDMPELEQGVIIGNQTCPRLSADPKFSSILTVATAWLGAQVNNFPAGITAEQRAWAINPTSKKWVQGALESVRTCNPSNIKPPAEWDSSKSGLSW